MVIKALFQMQANSNDQDCISGLIECLHLHYLGQDTSEPSLVLVKPRKDMNNVSCHRDMTEILLKAA